MNIQQGSFPSSQVCEVAIKALVAGPFNFPEDVELVSAVYSISFAKPLLKPVELEIQHCVSLTREDQAEYLSFMISNKTDAARCHNLDLLEGGEFYPGKRYGKIKQIHFCKTGIVRRRIYLLIVDLRQRQLLKMEMVIMIIIVFISNDIIIILLLI